MQKLNLKIVIVVVFICLLSACSNKAEFPADIKCNNCAIIIENDLQKTDGVKKVNADMEKQIVIVKYDNKIVSEQQLAAVLNKTIEKFGAYNMSLCGIADTCKKCCIEKCCKVTTGKTTCETDCKGDNSSCGTDSKNNNENCCDDSESKNESCC